MLGQLRDQYHLRLSAHDAEFELRHERELASALGEPAFQREHRLGAMLSLDEATELARQLASNSMRSEP